MAEKLVKAYKREVTTKGARNQLRRDGNIPLVFYSKEKDPISLYAHKNQINPLVFTSERHIVKLEVEGGESLDCLVKAVQFDPITDEIIHCDFIGIVYGQVTQLEIPIVTVGTAKGTKEGGMVEQQLNRAEIECLPRDIPQQIEVDITELEIGDSIHVSDITLEDVKILTPGERLVVAVMAPQMEEEPEEEGLLEGEEMAEPEVIGKGKSDDEDEESEEDSKE